VSSAIVNTPPPNGVVTLVHSLSKLRHRNMHHAHTDEEIVLDSVKCCGADMVWRNWCCITLQSSGELLFDIRVEKEKEHGETVIPLPGVIQQLIAPRSYRIQHLRRGGELRQLSELSF